MRSHIGWRWERNIKGIGNFSLIDVFCYKIVKLMTIRNKTKRTIFASSRLVSRNEPK